MILANSNRYLKNAYKLLVFINMAKLGNKIEKLKIFKC